MDVSAGVKTKVGTNLFGKGQRVISDAYREGYDRTFGSDERVESTDPKTKSEPSE